MLKKFYDLVIVGAGPAGIFTAYESIKLHSQISILLIDKGYELSKRKCPIIQGKAKKCLNCNVCSIMNGFGGAGAFSDGKYNITNNFGGKLFEYIGKVKSTELMNYVDSINLSYCGDEKPKLYCTKDSPVKKLAMQNGLNLLDAEVRHLGTDVNYQVLSNMYEFLKDKIDFSFNSEIVKIDTSFKPNTHKKFTVRFNSKSSSICCDKLVLAVGRSGSKWLGDVCSGLGIKSTSNKVDIGVRVELPSEIFEHITSEVYEGKLVYKTEKYSDLVRTFCMNPNGIVVSECTNGIITVNGHSYNDPSKYSPNTNFAILVSNKFTEPFKDSNKYGEYIAGLSNMLGGGILVQQFGDLIKGQRSTESRMKKSFVIPTLNAEPGDLSLVLPKRHLDNIIEMIYALDKIAPGTANPSTLLYGVEVKFYNSEIEVNNFLETCIEDLYIIGDCSGVTHSLSHASASGIYVARNMKW